MTLGIQPVMIMHFYCKMKRIYIIVTVSQIKTLLDLHAGIYLLSNQLKNVHIVSEFSKIKLFLPETCCPMPQQRKQLYSVYSTSSICFSSQ